MPVKAAPVQYVKICSLYGDGFYYIPGTDTCLKMGGYLRVQAEYNMPAAAASSSATAHAGSAPQGRFTRDLTNDINYRVRGAISWDVRQQTEYGTLRTYIRFGAENTTPADTGGGTTFNPFWDRAFIQFAGFTVGRSQSFFDLFTYGGAYSYHNVRVSGDTGASGQNLWAYTAQFGNGFSGTLSLEDPATRKGGGTVDLHGVAFFGFNGAIVNDNGLTINNARTSASGCLTSSPTCGLIRPGALSASAPLCMTPAAPIIARTVSRKLRQQRPSRRQVRLGVGWRRQVQPAGRRHDRLQRLLLRRRGRLLHQHRRLPALQQQQQVGLAWIADGVFATGTQIELTKVWSALAGYEHIWNPKWRTSVLAATSTSTTAAPPTNLILQHTPGRGGGLRRPRGRRE